MDIKTFAPAEAIEAVTPIEDIEVLRATATDLGITFSGNTGMPKLKTKIIEHLEAMIKAESAPTNSDEAPADFGGDDEEIEVAVAKPAGLTVTQLLEMDAQWEEDPAIRRQIIRAKAMKLTRVTIQNLDPSEVQLSGAIISVSNKYTGKVAKYIPFGEESENGYHVPEILLNFLRNQKFVLRRVKKGGAFGVKKYSTTFVNKFNITVLPPLTEKEIADLAAHQTASGAIDKSA